MKRKTVMTMLSVIAAGMMVFSPVTAIAAEIEEAGQIADSSEVTSSDFAEDTKIVLLRGKYLSNHVHGVSGSPNYHVICDTDLCNLILEQMNRVGYWYTHDCWNFGMANKHALAADTTCGGMEVSEAGSENCK